MLHLLEALNLDREDIAAAVTWATTSPTARLRGPEGTASSVRRRPDDPEVAVARPRPFRASLRAEVECFLRSLANDAMGSIRGTR